MGNRLAAAVFALVATSSMGCSHAATTSAVSAIEAPTKILFVGNSFTYYNDSLHNHIRRLLRAAATPDSPSYRLRIMTISGARLAEHAAAMPAIVAAENWDAVVLQGHSTMANTTQSADDFRAAARDFDRIIRAHGAKTVLFMTWAYTESISPGSSPRSRPRCKASPGAR